MRANRESWTVLSLSLLYLSGRCQSSWKIYCKELRGTTVSSTVCLEFGSGLARNREAGHPTQGDHPLELGLVQAEPLKNARILQCFTAGGFGRMLRQSDLLGYSGFRFQSIYIFIYSFLWVCIYTRGPYKPPWGLRHVLSIHYNFCPFRPRCRSAQSRLGCWMRKWTVEKPLAEQMAHQKSGEHSPARPRRRCTETNGRCP